MFSSIIPIGLAALGVSLLGLLGWCRYLMKERARDAIKLGQLRELHQLAARSQELMRAAIEAEDAKLKEADEKIAERTYFN